jgi:hypothetical protein
MQEKNKIASKVKYFESMYFVYGNASISNYQKVCKPSTLLWNHKPLAVKLIFNNMFQNYHPVPYAYNI